MAFYAENNAMRHNSSIDLRTTICHAIDYRLSSGGGNGGGGDGGDCDDNASSGSEGSNELDECGLGMNGHTYRTDTTVASSPAYKQIRYLNSATYIQPQHDSFVGSQTPRNCDGGGGDGDINNRDGSMSTRVGGGGGGVNGGGDTTNGNITTDDDCGDHGVANKPPNVASIYMPTLDLDRNSWSSNDLTFTHRKGDEKNSKELIRKTEAFKEWLAAKTVSEKYAKRRKAEAVQRQQEATRREEEQRRAERDQKLKEWLEKKQIVDVQRADQLRLEQQQLQSVEQRQSSVADESLKNYNAWLEKKLRYERALRERQRHEMQREEQLEQAKRELAGAEYERWLETAADKPKPVPLNRGLFTLKGSISNMYVNPVPWDDSTDVPYS